MALFKIAKGPESGLANKEIHEGYCYVAHNIVPSTENTENPQPLHYFFYVDVSPEKRAKLAASYAEEYPVTIKTWSVNNS